PTIDELRLLEEFEISIPNLIIENEALIYIADYVAHKFRHKYREICLAYRNCLYPSKDLQTSVDIINEEFHGLPFNNESDIFDKLTSIVCKGCPKINGRFELNRKHSF
ncbi:hypothetical protein ALC56_01416, partial [Trachymyrmex septentrionalis]